MKSRKTLIVLLALVFTITCMPLTAMASEPIEPSSNAIDLLSEGYTIINADGSPVITPYWFEVGTGITLTAGQSLIPNKDIWYGSDIIAFYASVSGADVSKLRLAARPLTSSTFTNVGYFTATQGTWYGVIEKSGFIGYYNQYHKIRITNTSNSTMTVDSLTGDEYTP